MMQCAGQSAGSVKGIGIDLVRISEIKQLDKRTRGSFVARTFTDSEQAEAQSSLNPWMYYAERYAVKEAVFKAVAHLTNTETFDFRIVETLQGANGIPMITQTNALAPILTDANVAHLFVTISSNDNYCIAFVLAC